MFKLNLNYIEMKTKVWFAIICLYCFDVSLLSKIIVCKNLYFFPILVKNSNFKFYPENWDQDWNEKLGLSSFWLQMYAFSSCFLQKLLAAAKKNKWASSPDIHQVYEICIIDLPETDINKYNSSINRCNKIYNYIHVSAVCIDVFVQHNVSIDRTVSGTLFHILTAW